MFGDENLERRSKPRIKLPIPATVRSTNSHGEPFEIQTVLDDLSVSGLHVRLHERIEAAASLFAAIRFAGMEIDADGVVKRIEPQPDGSFGLAVAFESYRIFGLQYDQ